MQLSFTDLDGPDTDDAGAGGRLERRFDAPFVARLALREKQVQQSYRPVIGIHKWFARRPGSVFRSLLLAEFGDRDLSEAYWRGNRVDGVVADPFMGGGTTVFESLRLGLGVVAGDVSPMSYWLVRQAVEPLDEDAFTRAGQEVHAALNDRVGDLYETRCTGCGDTAPVKYFLWVKTCRCPGCSATVSLFPGLRVAESVRHPKEVYTCPTCDTLHEFAKGEERTCPTCARDLSRGNARRGKTECLACGHTFAHADHLASPPEHRLFAIEYQCSHCYAGTPGRQFKSPDAEDHARVGRAADRLAADDTLTALLPDEEIPEGDETNRLLRWKYRTYRQLFGVRQQLGLATLAGLLRDVPDRRTRHALATVFSDALRYQNLLCRYDTYALKCQDIFSVHGFPVGLVVCENNLAGIPRVGSGSFVHFLEKYAKAKRYAREPYETLPGPGPRRTVPAAGETIEAPLTAAEPDGGGRAAWLRCGPSQAMELRPGSIDAVLTDPPYYDNVQYAELMDFCYVWLRRVLGDEVPEFRAPTTRTPAELTGNRTLSRGLDAFTAGLSDVFTRMARALKPGAPFAFTYHHNDPEAYVPLAVAMLDAGFTCTAVLPAPAEMAASLHIAGTNSSILDSIFVCRDATTAVPEPGLPMDTAAVDAAVARDTASMRAGGYACTAGDTACLRAGHVAAAAVRTLAAAGWDAAPPVEARMDAVRRAVRALT
ncbi:DUF1156 domain-containing protein [Streptomyces sp. RFCAC02]|uniref:DUF1156 domain-containing protein n=1 Tax=Streptomyces sp. RFCAC02 TaxID=2499143 RepID=UPI00102072F6|nr:DUF1156 domain-containing protein [Streptomyces sp. RFCAC02]